MDVVRQSLGTGGFYGFDPIGQHGAQDVDHLPIATRLTFQFAPHTADRHRQCPFLEGRPIAKGTGFASQNGYIMQGIEDRFVPPEGPLMLADDLPILPTFQPIGVSSDLDRPPHGVGID